MKMKSVTVALFVIQLAALPAFAADHEVIQKDKVFSQEAITVNAGDTVTFKNEDDVAHNLFSKSDSKVFEIPKQPPGSKEAVTFDKAGEVKIRCAIHPKMKLTVTVK
jgi:plastocyanin